MKADVQLTKSFSSIIPNGYAAGFLFNEAVSFTVVSFDCLADI